MQMDPGLIWDMFQTGLTSAIGLYVWIDGRQRASAAQIKKMDDDLCALRQLSAGAPTHGDISAIRVAMETQKGETHVIRAAHEAQQAQIRALNYSIDRVNNFLLENRGRK